MSLIVLEKLSRYTRCEVRESGIVNRKARLTAILPLDQDFCVQFGQQNPYCITYMSEVDQTRLAATSTGVQMCYEPASLGNF